MIESEYNILTNEAPLESWKEIAAYLQRDVRTLMRWEKHEGLPVHRHRHLARSSVYAYPTELEAWRANRKPAAEAPGRVWRRPLPSAAFAVTLLLALALAGSVPRVGSVQAADGIVTRQVWTGPKVDTTGSVSPDGRYLSYVDWATGDLALHDLVTGADRRLTDNARGPYYEDFAEESVFSPDGTQIAYSWFTMKTRRYDLRLVGLNGKSSPTPRVLFDDQEVGWIGAYDWSRDGKWIAVWGDRKDRTQFVGLVSATDGSLRVLMSTVSGVAGRPFFSRDGRYLALDQPSEEIPAKRDIFLLPIEGKREMIPAVVHPASDEVMGWSPDGSRLLFTSDRTGAPGLWSIRISDGRPQGGAELIKPEVGGMHSLGLTASGTLVYGSRIGGVNVQVASIDFDTGKLLSPAVNPIPDFLGFNSQPDWSPDGEYLAYSRRGLRVRDAVIVIRSLKTGQARELRPKTRELRWPRWRPDARSLAVWGTDLGGRPGIFLVDAQNGDVTPIAVAAPGEEISVPEWGRDGTRIYYPRQRPDTHSIVERDVATGTEREIMRRKILTGVFLSPDQKWIATRSREESAKAYTILVSPVAGGESRELVRVTDPDTVGVLCWAPDSNSILVRKRVSTTLEYWQIPLSGSEPRRLDLKLDNTTPFRVHPDGHRVAYSSGNDSGEVWVMENFLPGSGLVQ